MYGTFQIYVDYYYVRVGGRGGGGAGERGMESIIVYLAGSTMYPTMYCTWANLFWMLETRNSWKTVPVGELAQLYDNLYIVEGEELLGPVLVQQVVLVSRLAPLKSIVSRDEYFFKPHNKK